MAYPDEVLSQRDIRDGELIVELFSELDSNDRNLITGYLSALTDKQKQITEARSTA